ncbi:hypothetical protein OF83DRAFT_538917 [Amylostereum chailletii]|nr:hypothetical protein OF83DRAFT_538917 [Amylostereum chailletii]
MASPILPRSCACHVLFGTSFAHARHPTLMFVMQKGCCGRTSAPGKTPDFQGFSPVASGAFTQTRWKPAGRRPPVDVQSKGHTSAAQPCKFLWSRVRISTAIICKPTRRRTNSHIWYARLPPSRLPVRLNHRPLHCPPEMPAAASGEAGGPCMGRCADRAVCRRRTRLTTPAVFPMRRPRSRSTRPSASRRATHARTWEVAYVLRGRGCWGRARAQKPPSCGQRQRFCASSQGTRAVTVRGVEMVSGLVRANGQGAHLCAPSSLFPASTH